MDTETLPALSLAAPAGTLSRDLGESFRRYGFAMVRDHGIDPDLIARGWHLTGAFFALPEAEKRAYFIAGQAGARGYTPFGMEIAKGAVAHDLKEFWHVGREADVTHPLADGMPANIWPEHPCGFRDTFNRLYAEFDRVGSVLLARIAVYLGLAPDWFDTVTAQGNSILRLLHYPPIRTARDGAIRAGAHEDINLITLLLGAEEAGLELLTREGNWISVSPPPGAMVINIGDMLQRLTNHILPSTTHRVRNPAGERAGFSRYSMPFFLHPRGDYPIVSLTSCVSAANPDRYPVPITADAYLQERLYEIGLKR